MARHFINFTTILPFPSFLSALGQFWVKFSQKKPSKEVILIKNNCPYYTRLSQYYHKKTQIFESQLWKIIFNVSLIFCCCKQIREDWKQRQIQGCIKIHGGEWLTKHCDVILLKCFVNYSPPGILIHSWIHLLKDSFLKTKYRERPLSYSLSFMKFSKLKI